MLLALGLNAFLAPDIFGKETTLCDPERASPEKYGPVSEDTALGLFLCGMDREVYAHWAWKGEAPSSYTRPSVAPVSISDGVFPTPCPHHSSLPWSELLQKMGPNAFRPRGPHGGREDL